MASPVVPRAPLIDSLEVCGTEEVVRRFNNGLYISEDGTSKLTVPKYEYSPLNIEPQEARLLKLHPANDLAEHVRCTLETHHVTQLPPFVAIKNARGYRNIEEAIEVDGHALLISPALERFLRYLRTKIDKPTLIWVRYACVIEFDPSEQKTYWTREFSDKMYALASEAIDMHQINNRLIENGYFENVVDARYSKWNKVWIGRDGQMVLPRVCPIRLGTKPSIDEPTMEYRYMPLDMVMDEIRIMCIMPAEDMAAPIVMHAAHCPIKCEVTYIALSYRWGTDETPDHIVLNGQRKSIRKNLAEAIRAIRMTDKIVPIWIDAMSINQDDVMERTRQVRRMGQIYDNAMSVYSFVGLPDQSTEDVSHFIAELNKHPMVRMNNSGEFHLGDWEYVDGTISYGENMIRADRLAKLCAALYRFLTRQYFRRCWILQEVALASNPTILAGRLAVTFEMLDMAAYNFHDMLTRDPSLAGQMLAADPSLGNVSINMLAYPRKLFYFRYLVSKGSGGGSLAAVYAIKKTSPGFLETLILARDFECTDPRDHIFSLWNLAHDKTGLQFVPNYNTSYEENYAEFARAWIMQHGALDILGAVEVDSQQHSDFYRQVPSWCPNWNVPATASCLVRKDHLPTRFMSIMNDLSGKLYSADGSMTQDLFDSPILSFEGKALHCTGVVIDQIKSIFEDAPDIPAGTAPKSHWRAHYWAHAMEEYYQKQDAATYDDPLRAIWAMFHGDSVAAWPSIAESGYAPDICEPNERYVCLPKLSRHVDVYGNSYSRTEAWNAVDSVLRGRRPFVTENGYMGLAPAYLANVEPENVASLSLAVVAGCSVPLVLQEREDGTYGLVGTCFVQGWMDGEWMETMMGAEDARDFWVAIQDGAKLVIS